MYKVDGSRIFADERIRDSKACMERTANIAAGVGVPESEIHWFTDDDLPRVIETNGWIGSNEGRGSSESKPDPDFILTKFDFSDGFKGRVERLTSRWPGGASGLGVGQYTGQGMLPWREHLPEEDKRDNMVCRFSHQYATAAGCLHRCLYCAAGGGLGRTVTLMLNIEEFIEKAVIPCHEESPWQKAYRFDTASTDTLCFEPEYDCLRPLIEFYGTTGKYIVIHTKSANVDPIIDLNHNGHTIMVWSMTAESQSRLIEKKTATPGETIDAATRTKEAGYTVRFKFKPIVPVKNWRQEATEMLDMLLSRVEPDNLAMCTVAWMSLYDLENCIPEEMLDKEMLGMAREAREEMRGVRTGPLPHEARKMIYTHYIKEIRKRNKTVPIALSTETPELWKELGPLMGSNRRNFVCGCGPMCVPGLKRLPKKAAAKAASLTSKD